MGFSLGVRAGVCPSPAQEQPGILYASPGLLVFLMMKGLSCRLDSALGLSCSCHEPPLALHRSLLSDHGSCGLHLPRGRPCPTRHVCWRLGLQSPAYSLQPASGALRHKKRPLCKTQADRKAVVSPGGQDRSSQTGEGWAGGLGFWEHRPEINFTGRTLEGQEDSRATLWLRRQQQCGAGQDWGGAPSVLGSVSALPLHMEPAGSKA